MIGIIDYNAGNITSVERALKNLNIDENTRGESLSIEMFGKLSEELCKLK